MVEMDGYEVVTKQLAATVFPFSRGIVAFGSEVSIGPEALIV
jgi:hypothetical protein